MRRLACATALFLACALPAPAQLFQRLFNPDVRVTLTHPPGLGINVKRVAFAPTTDSRAEELVNVCLAELSTSETIELVDRSNLERVLNEQKFSNSGLVDSAQAVELGRLLGSPVLLMTKVYGFKTTQTPLVSRSSWKDKKGEEHVTVTYTAKTQAELSASVQAVDCATGKIYSVQRIVASPSLENTSTQGQPEYPSETQVRERALAQAKVQVIRMLLPWTEDRKLIFYDDKDYGMKDAYKALERKDYPGATALSMEALARAKDDKGVKPRFLARTNYNLGMCKFIQGDYEAAQPYLRAAAELESDNGIFKESLGECQRGLQLQKDMAKVEARSAAFTAAPASAPQPAPAAAPAAAPATGGSEAGSVEERLERLERLKKKGLITADEYAKRRAELMKLL